MAKIINISLLLIVGFYVPYGYASISNASAHTDNLLAKNSIGNNSHILAQQGMPTVHRPIHRPKPDYTFSRGRYHGYYRHDGKRWYWYTGVIPTAAVILYHSHRHAIYGCLATYKGKHYEGRMRARGPCYINYRGKSVAINQYYILTH